MQIKHEILLFRGGIKRKKPYPSPYELKYGLSSISTFSSIDGPDTSVEVSPRFEGTLFFLTHVRLFLIWIGMMPSVRWWWSECEKSSGSSLTKDFLCSLHHGLHRDHIPIQMLFYLIFLEAMFYLCFLPWLAKVFLSVSDCFCLKTFPSHHCQTPHPLLHR